MRDVFHLRARWQPAVLALALLVACLPFAARALVGNPGARIHVRWQPSLDEAARDALERRFRLDTLDRLDDVTWRYDLIDTSTENIRALVSHPAVADTHEIDRPNYTLASTALRTARRERFAYGSGIVRAVDVLAIALAALAALLTLKALTHTVPALRSLRVRLERLAVHSAVGVRRIANVVRRIASPVGRALAPGARFVQRGVPEIDARTAGLFRIVFGVTTLAYFAFPTHRVDASWLSTAFDPEVEGPVHLWVMEFLRAHPGVVEIVTPWLIATGVAFVVGLFTRLTYALFVAGVVLWAYVAMSIESTHPHSTLVLTLVALVPSRWGDAWSVDSWLLRRRGREPLDGAATKRYGYTLWVPVLTFGVGFGAAAWAKLTVPPYWTSWILNGSIKYHIISDSASAPVAWGLQLVRHPVLAVLASFAAIAVEALVVTAAFSRNERYRLAMGLAAAALFAGIGVFMGIVWPGWWIPLLAFLPWQHVGWALTARLPFGGAQGTPSLDECSGRPEQGRGARQRREVARRNAAPYVSDETVGRGFTPRQQWLTAVQLIVVAAVIMQQLVVSALKLERAPMFSWYDMYARSYSGPADYNSSIPPTYRVVLVTDRGRVQLRCNPHEEFVRDFEAAVGGSPESTTRVWRALRGCGADFSNVDYVILEGTARTFDWDRLEFTPTHALTRGPLVPHRYEISATPR